MLPRFFSPGPLFGLEMVTSARRARYFVIRVLYAGALFFALFCLYISNNEGRGLSGRAEIAEFAWSFFCIFSVMQLLVVAALGPAMAAGTIAQERERRTIEYLFASTLCNAEIVLGKLLARLMHVAYLVLAGMPILFIAMLMGGIAPEAIVVLTIVTISTALTVSIISITVSVWSARAREAVVRAYLVIIALLVLPPILLLARGTWFYDTFLDPINEQLLAANPFYTLVYLLETASSANTALAWDALLALVRNQGVACVIGATAATLAVRRVHLKAAGSAPKTKRRRFYLFRPAIGDRPMLWKELVAEPAAARLGALGRIAVMLILFGILAPTAWIFFTTLAPGSARSDFQEYFRYCSVIGAFVGCGGLLLIAARAAGSITSEKRAPIAGCRFSARPWNRANHSRQNRRKSLVRAGHFRRAGYNLGAGRSHRSRLWRCRRFFDGHIFYPGRVCQRTGPAFFALVPHLDAGHGRHPGHRSVCRRLVPFLLHPHICRIQERAGIGNYACGLHSFSFGISQPVLLGNHLLRFPSFWTKA